MVSEVAVRRRKTAATAARSVPNSIKEPISGVGAGAREFAWIKLKREYSSELTDTIDLVIIGAFHGKGRRAGVYGTYLLAAYDGERKMFPSVTKIGTGFSDADLERFPKLLRPFESEVKPPDVESNLVPDVWYLAQCFREAFEELLAAAEAAQPRQTPTPERVPAAV